MSEADASRPQSPAKFDFVAWCVLWLALLVYSAVTAPVPAVNEPHYLCKARHAWDSQWCAGDLFLESFDAHAVFYGLFGWWTTWLPLPVVAWTGRAIACAWLASGFVAALGPLLPRRGQLWLTVAGWLLLQSIGSFSGEWVVGGLEGKVFAYAGLLCAWAAVNRDRPILAGCWTGLAISFHPVVGVWGLLAGVGAGLVQRLTSRRETTAAPWTSRWLLRHMTALVAMLLAALPGLVPVLELLSQPVAPEVKYAGTYLQVFHRLGHHLDPMRFPASAWLGYGGLLVAFVICSGRAWSRPLWRGWWLLTLAAVLFTVAGIAVGAGPRPPQLMPWFDLRMHLLKFYPFRLADALLPLTVCLLAATCVRSGKVAAALAGVCLIAALTRGHLLAQEKRVTQERDPAWIAVCDWIREHTPRTALVLTPPDRGTFKWNAERAEYVNFKDCPQDVTGIVEWNRRLQFQTKWFSDHYADQLYSAKELEQLAEATGASYLVTERLGPMESAPVFEAGGLRVYALRR